MSWQQKDEDEDSCHIGTKHGNWLHTVTVIMQVTKKQGEVFMVDCVFLSCTHCMEKQRNDKCSLINY